MSFRELLKTLVDSVPGAEGAVFADWEGEAVDCFSLCQDLDHVKFIGAHHGILLDAIKKITANTGLGQTRYVVIRSEKSDYITAPVHDGYYLVLAVKTGSSLVRVDMALGVAIEKLRHEMGY